jgi:hypothetical protein
MSAFLGLEAYYAAIVSLIVCVFFGKVLIDLSTPYLLSAKCASDMRAWMHWPKGHLNVYRHIEHVILVRMDTRGRKCSSSYAHRAIRVKTLTPAFLLLFHALFLVPSGGPLRIGFVFGSTLRKYFHFLLLLSEGFGACENQSGSAWIK